MHSSYDIANGMLGMNRDIMLKLSKKIKNDCKKIRSLFGMCEEHYGWKKHSFFLSERPHNVRIALRPNAMGGCAISDAHVQFTVTKGMRTVFLDTSIIQGIFRWIVRIEYGKPKCDKRSHEASEFWIGAAPVHRVPQFENWTLSWTKDKGLKAAPAHDMTEWILGANADGSCSFNFCRKIANGSLSSQLRCFRTVSLDTKVTDGSLVSIEVDMQAHTVSFFAGDEKVPHSIVFSDATMCLGMTGDFHRSSFTSMHFLRLLSPTPSAVKCTLHSLSQMNSGT